MKLPKNAVGLCAGRHNIPVEKHIFTDVQNVLDFKTLNHIAAKFILDNCNPHTTVGQGVSQDDDNDVTVWTGDPLDVVVTGLTACTSAVMYACACYGINLTLWHYDRDSGEYVPQKFLF